MCRVSRDFRLIKTRCSTICLMGCWLRETWWMLFTSNWHGCGKIIAWLFLNQTRHHKNCNFRAILSLEETWIRQEERWFTVAVGLFTKFMLELAWAHNQLKIREWFLMHITVFLAKFHINYWTLQFVEKLWWYSRFLGIRWEHHWLLRKQSRLYYS